MTVQTNPSVDALDTAGGPGATPDGQPRRRSSRTVVRNVLLAVWVPIVALVLWYVLSNGSQSPFFPPLHVILHRWWTAYVTIGDGRGQIWPSLRHLFLGYVLGVVVGYVVGTVLWKLPWVRRATNPFVYFLYVLPAPALLPAMIALFGVGGTRQVMLISFGAVWPTLLNTMDGMRGIDQVKFDNAKAMHFGWARTLFAVVLPGSAPQAAAGLRASLQVSIILMVVSEMVASNSGIGYFILQAQTMFDIPSMWAGIITLAIIGTVLNYLFVLAEHSVLDWYYRSRALVG